jgi:hypothetical protein
VERRVQAQFLPETAEHQVGADMPQGPGLQAPCLIALDHPNLVSEAAQGFQRDLHAAACGEFVAAAQRGQDPLHGAFAFPVVLHDLEIAVRAIGFASDKHAVPPSGHRNCAGEFPSKSGNRFAKTPEIRHRIFPKSVWRHNNINHLRKKIGGYCGTRV